MIIWFISTNSIMIYRTIYYGLYTNYIYIYYGLC